MTRVSEVIRGWLGWCPDRMMAPRFRTFRESNPVSLILHGDRGYIIENVIMDYGSTGMSIPLFTIILAGTIAGLFAIMNYGLESWSSLGLLVLSIFFLYTAVRMVHQDIKKAIIEFTPDTITVRWPLSKPVIIVKEAITAIEVRKNIHHSHRWLSRSAIMIFFVGVIPTILFSGQSQVHFPGDFPCLLHGFRGVLSGCHYVFRVAVLSRVYQIALYTDACDIHKQQKNRRIVCR